MLLEDWELVARIRILWKGDLWRKGGGIYRVGGYCGVLIRFVWGVGFIMGI